MTPQEAQQAQTIKRYGHTWEGTGARTHQVFGQDPDGDYVEYEAHNAIVDSQAQKIAEARECAERMKAMLEQAGAEGLIDNDADLTLPWGEP